MSSTDTHAETSAKISRTPIYIILGLAIAMVVGVLFGARFMFQQAATQPVAMPELPSPGAQSQECADFIASLPERVMDYPRAEIAEPAPAGVAAWQRSSTERVTLRCGVEWPLQFHAYAQPEDIGGTRWLRVDDVAGTTMSTWFTTDRSPVVAVTADLAQLRDGETPVDRIDAAQLPVADVAVEPAPLSQLPAGDTAGCGSIAAPDSIAEGYTRIDVSEEHTYAWTSPGKEPIVLRCGVAEPEAYEAGAQLTQINDVPWFEDPLASGGAAGRTMYALGREAMVAAYLPMGGGNEAITNLTELISQNVPEARSAG
ncbi:DUF3515 domain-containing protein [Corynebacterium sp. CNCTC7651]|uniref:DUF3515 domain-containing protein n=1 Tax=Corynebacterium sp. CNCTC7651 TaxID=2815361 RepID=UPI001F2EF39A|nr:DUF3515 domain-containing protein [Corynebacterium sp. CNCTC7651]UIZ93036.1 DUF3515 domain-containing protein [Corynebacterium sp. CNCTC7651]